jgi:hypothetical protein
MLSLHSSQRLINQYICFQDDADALKYYYVPQTPHLDRINSIPQFKLIKYKGQTDAGGLLTLGVSLATEPNQLEQVRQQLPRSSKITLDPMQFVSGSAQLTLFDRTYEAKPDLLGDNRALFSILLKPEEVTLIQGALEDKTMPIGVVYALDYLAIRPAYSYQLKVDWSRVQRKIEEKFQLGLILLKVEIENLVGELLEEKAIEIQIKNLAGDEATRQQLAAISELQEMILSTFFRPRLQPAQLSTGSNQPLILGFRYSKTDVTQIEKRSLNLTMDQQSIVQRRIYPQALLENLLSELTNLNQYIELMNVSDRFSKRTVKAICRTDFEKSGIFGIIVTLKYGAERKQLRLNAENPQGELSWRSILIEGMMQWDVTASYEVSFKGSLENNQFLKSIRSKEIVIKTGTFEINPQELYTLNVIPIVTTSKFPWDRYDSVQVRIKYTVDEDSEEATQILTQSEREKSWSLLLNSDFVLPTFQYQLIFNPTPGNSSYRTAWQKESDQIVITDPFPYRRTVEVILSKIPWDKVDWILVDLQYQDLANNINESNTLKFTAANPNRQTFSVYQRDREKQLVQYKVTIQLLDGSTQETQASTLVNQIFLKLN